MKTAHERKKPRGLFLAVAAAVAALSVGTAWAVDWVELGPAPLVEDTVQHTGRVSAIACSRVDPGLWYVAGADGGVWKTTDYGLSWTPLTDHMPTTAIGAVAIDPVNEDIVYAGTGEANYANHSRYGLGLYKSTDAGQTWEVLAADVFAGRCFSKILIDDQNPQRIFASITRAGGFPEMAAAKGHPGATGPLGVFRSEDGGQTWTQLTGGLPNLSATDLVMDSTDPNTLYAGIGRIFGSSDNGIYKTLDGGDTWTRLTGGLPLADTGRVSIAIPPSRPWWVFAMISNQSNASGGAAGMMGIYRSLDSGATWARISGAPSMQATYGWYLSVLAIHPLYPANLFAGGVTMHRSSNGGGDWSTITPPHVDIHAIVFNADNQLVVGDDGGVHYSSGQGSMWETRNDGLGLAQCYAGLSTHPTVDESMVVGLQDNGTVQRDTDGAWLHRIGGDGGWTQLGQADPSYVFGEYQGTGNLFRSQDGGETFQAVGGGIASNDRNAFLPPYLVDPTTPGRMLYGTQRVWLSTDWGLSWTPHSEDLTGGNPASIRTMAMAPSHAATVYAATNDGRILVSTDGGANFTLILEGADGWPRVTRELFVHPQDPDTLYLAGAVFGQPHVRRTCDRGQTWETLDGDLPDLPVNVVAVDVRGNLPIIYAGSDAGVYRTVNGGRSWHRWGTGLPNACVIDFRFQPQRGRLIACTQGRGIWQIPVGLPGDLNGDGEVNNFDIRPFVLALTDPESFAEQYPEVDRVLNGDFDGDGVVDTPDINRFVEILLG